MGVNEQLIVKAWNKPEREGRPIVSKQVVHSQRQEAHDGPGWPRVSVKEVGGGVIWVMVTLWLCG